MSETLNPTPHLNRSRVKKTALEMAALKFGAKKTRVGSEFLVGVEADAKAAIRRRVSIQSPSGKTLT